MKKYVFLFMLLFVSSVFALNATLTTTPNVATVYEDFLVNFTLNETQDVKEINISIPNGLSFIASSNNTNTTADFYEEGNLTWNSSSTFLEANTTGWFSANFSATTSGNYTFNISTYNDTSLIETRTYDITVYENEFSISPTSYYITEEFIGNFTITPTQDVYKINVTFDTDFEIDNTTYGATFSDYVFSNTTSNISFYNETNSILNATEQGSFWINLTGLAEGTYNFTVSLYNDTSIFNTTNVSFTVDYRTLDFYGYTKDIDGNDLTDTNVTIDIYELTESGPSFVRSVSELSDPFFNLSIPINQSWLYQPVLNKNNNYVGQTLPTLPYSEFSSVSNVTFYLKESESIFINMTNQTDPINFTYILKDKETGFVVDESVLEDVKNVTFNVPKERDYSLLVIPNETSPSFPITYTIDDLSSSVSKEFNSSVGNMWINGTVELNDSSSITNLTIIPYLVESDDMVMFDNPFPLNMTGEDVYSGGNYNITLPTLSENMTLLLFANAYNGSEYFGAFKTITLNETGVQGNVTDFNFTAYPLVGETKNISTYSGTNAYNVTTKLINFTLQGMKEGSLQRPNSATIEMELNYSLLNNSYFKWSTHLSQTDNGTFVLPLLNYSVEDFTIFTQDFAPYRTSAESSDLNDTMTINLTTFDNSIVDPDNGSVFSDITISLFKSNSTCNAPGNSCDPLLSADISSFNPLSVIMGGGNVSLRITKSNGLTIHYSNVDLFASGPPGALMDDDSSDTESSSLFQQVWKFGSMGPEIYDEIILGIPYTEASDSTTGIDESENVTIEIPYLYEDDDFSTPIWNQSAGESIPSKYIEYNQSDYAYFVNGSSAVCDENDTNLTNGTDGYCYIDKSSNKLWIKIPHFSGIQPTVSGSILKENTDPCSSDSECYTGNCRDDYDSDGDGDGNCEDGEDCWCAPDDYCAHNGNVYADDYDTCYGDYLTSCDQGEWDMTECSYDCQDGECVSRSSSTESSTTYTTTESETQEEYLEIISDLDIEIKQGESGNLTVTVENKYNIDLDNIDLDITGLDNYTVEPEEMEIESDETGLFVVTIYVDNETEIGDYDFTVKAASLTRETEKDGTLTVLASEETQSDINQTYISLKENITDLENTVNSMDLENKEDVEGVLSSLKSKQNDIELAIENGNYKLAKSLISEAQDEISSLELVEKKTDYMKWAGIMIIVFVLAVGLFLLANKPEKKYEPGSYKYKKKKTVEEISRDIRRKLGKK